MALAIMNNIDAWVTHIDRPEDKSYLTTPLLDVNIRLFKANASYRGIVLACCEHLAHVCLTELDGYKLPHGASGANCALPFNIIAIALKRGTPQASAYVMINPRVLCGAGETTAMSNCGSIRLAAPIEVRRYERVMVHYFDTEGAEHSHLFTRAEGSFTVQHEVDHNLGILITDERRRA